MPPELKSELDHVGEDVSRFLQQLKQTGLSGVNISPQSRKTLCGWELNCRGDINSDLFFIDGESFLFSGSPGALLRKIIAAMKLSESSVFVCNAANRTGVVDKIEKGRPQAVVTLGSRAAGIFFENGNRIRSLRGRLHEMLGTRVIPTWHPAELLVDPSKKRDVWEDMKLVMKHLG